MEAKVNLDALFGTADERKSIDWAGMKAQNLELCAIHPSIDLSATATIPDGETIIDLMREVMDYWFGERIEYERPDGLAIAVVPIRGYWRIGRISGRGILKDKPAKCHPKMVELVFWSREAVAADPAMREPIPSDLLENIEWWFVGIDPVSDEPETSNGEGNANES